MAATPVNAADNPVHTASGPVVVGDLTARATVLVPDDDDRRRLPAAWLLAAMRT